MDRKPTGRMFVPLQPACGLIGRLALLALFALLALPPLRAETVLNVSTAPEAGATIRLAVPWTATPRFGFAPVRVSIENRADRERTWQVQFQSGMSHMFPGVLNLAQAIAVPAGQTREVWVYVPVAEPGTNIAGGAGGGMVSASVKIARTPNGMKVTRARPGAFSTSETVTEFNTSTGDVTTTNSRGKTTSLRSGASSARPGSTVTYTIDPANGSHTTSVHRDSGSNAPPVFKVVVGAPGSSGAGRPTSRAPASAAPGALLTLPGPSTPMMLVAEVTGPGVIGVGRVSFPGSTTANGMRPFAVSPPLESEFRAKLSAIISGAPNLAVIEPAQLPADWRVWSGFAGVLLTTDEYAALDAGRRSALRAWVALGGQLCLSPAAAIATDDDEALTEHVGAGSIVTLPVPLAEFSAAASAPPAAAPGTTSSADPRRLAEWQKEIEDRRAARAGGPGSAVVPAAPTAAPAAKVAAAPAAPAAAIPSSPLGSDIALFTGTPGLPDRGELSLDATPLHEVVREESTDNSWLAIFLVCFAVVVGPLNLFLFAPAKRRHRLFLTTPLIALAASLLLGATIFFQDGLGGAGARRACVVLLRGENQAAVFQEQAARTGFLGGRSFALPGDVAFTLLPIDVPAYGGPSTVLERGAAHAGGDWFRSRGRQAQHLRRIVPTRARIELVGTAPDGAPIVQSSLGTTLREFCYVDASGAGWRTADLPSGQRVTLRSGVEKWTAGTTLIGGSPNLRAVVAAATPLAPGRWCALGGATEFAPIATLASIRWTDAEILYAGEIENTAAGSSRAPANPGGQP